MGSSRTCSDLTHSRTCDVVGGIKPQTKSACAGGARHFGILQPVYGHVHAEGQGHHSAVQHKDLRSWASTEESHRNAANKANINQTTVEEYLSSVQNIKNPETDVWSLSLCVTSSKQKASLRLYAQF